MSAKPKNYPTAQALIDRAMKVDPALAADIRAFARSREYGLVFEHNRPEAMRLYGKPINVGDIVHILPDRGEKESVENRVEWRVLDVDGDKASLEQVDDACVTCEVIVDDVVAVVEYDQPIYAGLRETGRVERGGGTLGDPGDKPYHVVINSENYHALEALEFCYAGKVDCVYIDPPYNTGAKDWKYNNDYVGADDAYRHSKWLAWMERRLKLVKTLLNPDDSVLVCTIDEKEYLRLGLLLEQTFPEARIQMVSCMINLGGVSRQTSFSRTDEYIYCVMIGPASPAALRLPDEWLGGVKSTSKTKLHWDPLMRTGTNNMRADGPNRFYPVFVTEDGSKFVGAGESLALSVDRTTIRPPHGAKAIFPIHLDGSEGCWQVGQRTLLDLQQNHCVKLGKFTPRGMAITYLKAGQRKKVESGEFNVTGFAPDGSYVVDSDGYRPAYRPGTQWRIASHDAARYGSGLLRRIFGDKRFDFPKSLYAVEDVLRFFIGGKPNAIVLDFFAGSGTTAHAVMRLNHEDGGRRISISVTNNEVSAAEERELTAAGLRPGDADWEKHGICRDVTIPRVRAAITGLTPEGEPIKGDYKFTDPFPMADGFDENAVFFDLTYEDPDMVEFGEAFEQVAPLLWMRAGCRGRIIKREERDFAVADNYAALFDYAYMKQFADAIEGNNGIQTVYVVTDDDRRYANAKKMFPGRDVVRLYESYLHSFQMASEGALS